MLMLFYYLVGVALSGVFIYWVTRNLHAAALKQSLNYRLFLVKVPRDFVSEDQQKQYPNYSAFVSAFEQLLEHLSRYQKEIIFELAVPSDTLEISFYFACHKQDIDFLNQLVVAYFPFSQIEIQPKDFTVFTPLSFTSAAKLRLKENFAFPIKTFKSFNDDPLAAIINAFSKLSKTEEGAIFQLIVKPADKRSVERVKSIRQNIVAGKSAKEAIANPKSVAKEALKKSFELGFSSDKDKDKKLSEPSLSKLDETLVKLMEEKIQYPLFQVTGRLVATAEHQERADNILAQLMEPFSSFSQPLGNRFDVIKLKSQKEIKKLAYGCSFRLFSSADKMILNSAEIATVFHFPHPFIANPRIKWLKARSALPPLDLPNVGTVLGRSDISPNHEEIKILDNDRRRHIYVVGQTGTGKSTLLKQMIVSDIAAGKGVCFIDPHGDTAEEILGYIPESRFEEVIYFNPGNFKRSFGLNMLDWDPRFPFQKTFVVNELLEILDKLYDLKTVGGPIFEQYFRNSLLLLLDDRSEIHTLIDVPRVLTNPNYRRQLLDRSDNPLVKEFWVQEAEKAGGDLALANVAPYINSKLSPFLANDLVRPIIGQIHSSIDFREILDTGKIFIVNLSKGLLGDINSYLLGMIVVGKLMMAAFSRVDMPEEERKDYYLFIDEFQNVTTDTIATIFSEARKYHLSLTVANQYLAQLKEPILKSVFGNVGTLISFRVGRDDAEVLARYMAPVFNVYDLMNLDNFHAYIRLLIGNQVTRPFSLVTVKLPPPNQEAIHYLQEISAIKYGRDREDVEMEIKSRYK